MDRLRLFARNAQRLVAQGYYEARPPRRLSRSPSLLDALKETRGAGLIAEVKLRRPGIGALARRTGVKRLLDAYSRGGAVGISVLTEPKFFGGRPEDLWLASSTGLPVLMKDFVAHPAQIEAAARWGASCILLIQRLFDDGRGELPLRDCIRAAHRLGMETLLEAHTAEEFRRAAATDTDLLGINQRDLNSLRLRPGRAEAILKRVEPPPCPVIAMSGVETPAAVRRLHAAGASGILVGTALVRHEHPEELLARLREAAG